MCAKTYEEIEALREAGRIARECLEEMRAQVREGVTTKELNAVGAAVIAKHGARSAPMLVYDFPAENCISVNDELVHGIPSSRVVRPGDLVKLDVTIEKDGFMADTAITVAVGPTSDRQRALVECTEQAFAAAMKVARAGHRVRETGRAIATVA